MDGETLLDVDDEELQCFGVTNKAHRKKMLKKVERIKNAGADIATPTRPTAPKTQWHHKGCQATNEVTEKLLRTSPPHTPWHHKGYQVMNEATEML